MGVRVTMFGINYFASVGPTMSLTNIVETTIDL